MNTDKLSSYVSRLFTAAAAVLFLAGVLEWVLARFNVPLWFGYLPSRFTELAVMALMPVIVVLLRQIREELRKQK